MTSTRLHSRRPSSRRSSSSIIYSGLPPCFESPRSLCPQDTNAFAYHVEHLVEWHLPNEIWVQLPEKLQKMTAAMQHAGAAALTGFERLEKLSDSLPATAQEEEVEFSLDNLTVSDAVAAKLYQYQSHIKRTTSRDTEEFDCSPVPHEWRHLPMYSPHNRSAWSPTTGSSSPSPQSLPQTPSTPFTPPSPLVLERRQSNCSTRSFKSPPRDAQTAQYLAELDNLNKEALVRLRHAARRLGIEWFTVKQMLHPVYDEDEDETPPPLDKSLEPILAAEEQFENWWGEKKAFVQALDEQGKALGSGLKFSLGWNTHGLD